MTVDAIYLAYAGDTITACGALEELLLSAIIAGEEPDKKSFEQVLHGVKGMAATLKVADAADLCHAVESLLRIPLDPSKSGLLFALLDRCSRELADQAQAVMTNTPPRESSVYLRALLFRIMDEPFESGGARWPAQLLQRVDVDELDALFFEGVKRRSGVEKSASLSSRENLATLGAFFEDQANLIASSLGREISMAVDAPSVEVSAALMSLLRTQLGHLLRNAIDHGIEAPEERVQKGKPRRGRLSIRIELKEGDLVVALEDDGKGVDIGQLGKRFDASESEGTPGELISFLAEDGVTSKRKADHFSGRGLGVGAVKRAVEGQGGVLSMDSTPGSGTRFTFQLPLPAE